MRKWAAMAVAGLWAAGAGAADEAITAWLAAYPAKLDAIQSVQEKAEFRMEMAVGGMKSQNTIEMAFTYRRPDGLVAKGMMLDLYCLGTNATTYQPMKKEYRREQVAGLPEIVADYRMKMLMLMADKKVLLQTDADGRAAELEDFFTSEDARRLPDEELDGRTCDVFVDQMENMMGSSMSWAKIWLDAETGLLRRFENVPPPEWVKTDEAAEDNDVARALRDMKLSYAVTEQRVNGPVADEAFVFVPPEGATEDVATPEEVEAEEIAAEGQQIQESAGLDRFELSGQAAPDFELPLLDGGAFKMSAQTGKVVVIDFWATWCGPCVRALPEMKKLAEAYAENPDVVVVGFSTDDAESLEKVEKLVAKNGLGYAIGLGPDEAKKAYQVSGIPCIVVVGKDGVVQGRRVGFSPALEKDLKRAVDALLAGEALESATPYTAEELKSFEEGVCPKCGKKHGSSSARDPEKMNEKAFQLRWSREVQSADGENVARMGLDRISSAIPPRTFLRLDGTKALLVDAASGDVAKTLELPAEMCATNEQGEIPELVYLRTPEGESIVGYQEHYTVTRKGTSTNFRNRKSELFGLRLPDGEVWRKKLADNESIRGLYVVPVSAEWDLLVAATWNELKFLTAAGATALTQKLDYRTQALFAQDAAGKPILYLLGKKIDLYEIVWALAPAPEAPAAETPPATEPPAAEPESAPAESPAAE